MKDQYCVMIVFIRNQIKVMKMDKRQKLLDDVNKIFNNHGIHYFLLYGAVLGLYREKRVLPWDGDIDIGVFFESYNDLLGCKKDFENSNYSFIQKNKHGNIFICRKEDEEYFVKNKNNIHDVPYHISIYFFIKDWDMAVEFQLFNNDLFQRWFGSKNWLYTLFTLLRVKHRVYPLEWFEKLDHINGYPIPSCTERYLRYIYGDGWRVPVKTWSKYKHLQFNKSIRHYIVKEHKNRRIYYEQ